MENVEYIKCPRCGKEYTPCEIFIPKDFFGDCLSIEGHIYGVPMNLEENYTCDRCSTYFSVKASVQFTVIDENISFENDFVQKI